MYHQRRTPNDNTAQIDEVYLELKAELQRLKLEQKISEHIGRILERRLTELQK